MGSGYADPYFLSWKWVVSFKPRPLYPQERTTCTHWIGGWVDPRASLDDVEKRKFLILSGLELRFLSRPAHSQSLYRLRYPGSWIVMIKLCSSNNNNFDRFESRLGYWTSCLRIFFSRPLQSNARIVPGLYHDRFLPNSFQFIIHPIMWRHIVSILTASLNIRLKVKKREEPFEIPSNTNFNMAESARCPGS
jgi:hypothetical protein